MSELISEEVKTLSHHFLFSSKYPVVMMRALQKICEPVGPQIEVYEKAMEMGLCFCLSSFFVIVLNLGHFLILDLPQFNQVHHVFHLLVCLEASPLLSFLIISSTSRTPLMTLG